MYTLSVLGNEIVLMVADFTLFILYMHLYFLFLRVLLVLGSLVLTVLSTVTTENVQYEIVLRSGVFVVVSVKTLMCQVYMQCVRKVLKIFNHLDRFLWLRY